MARLFDKTLTMPDLFRHFFRIWCGVEPAPSPPGKVTVCQPHDQRFIRMAVMAVRADNEDTIA